MPVTPGRSLRPTTKVLPGQARGHNRSLVLQSLYSDGPQSRADLARVTALTPVTIGALVSELLTEGLVVELGTRTDSRVGKPARLVGFDPAAAHIVSIDLSSHQRLRGAILDLNGKLLTTMNLPRGRRTGAAAVKLVTELATRLVGEAERPVLGVGVGSPGVVDSAGNILDAPNLGWSGVPLAQILADAVERPVHVGNDANAAALAEHSFGGSGAAGVLVLTVGLGVGAGILLDGALIHGGHFAAGEIGHVTAEEDGTECACGRSGCLETVLAIPQLRARLADLGPTDQEKLLISAGERLGVTLAPVISTLDLAEIVLNGPPDLLGGALLDSLARTVRRRVMPVVAQDLDIRLSALHENSVLLGASVLVLSGELGVS